MPEPLDCKVPLVETAARKLNSLVTLLTLGEIDQVCPGGVLSFTIVTACAAVLKVVVESLKTALSILTAYSQFPTSFVPITVISRV